MSLSVSWFPGKNNSFQLIYEHQKLGISLENKLFQNLKLICFANKKGLPKLTFLNTYKKSEVLDDSWHRRSTLKIKFWPLLIFTTKLHNSKLLNWGAILKQAGSSWYGKDDPGYLSRCLQMIFSTFFFLKFCK